MKSHARGAFTLVELLVVMAVISMLLAILIPSFGLTFRQMNQMRCAKNLSTIGQAYGVRAADERLGTAGALGVGHWQAALLPYVGGRGDVFFCPEGPVPEEEGGSIETTAPRRLIIYSDPMGSSPSGPPLPPHWMRWDDVDLWAQGTYGADVLVKRVIPNVAYELWFEDSWRNNTWNDLQLKFTPHSNGQLEVEYVGQATGAYHYWLCDADTKEFLLPTEYPDQWMGCNATLSVGSKVVVESASGNTNYGMNSLARGDLSITPGRRVILCLDYVKVVARGATDTYPDDWRGEAWVTDAGLLVFARHDRRTNVLFTDGSVDILDPRDFDPIGVASVAAYWDPAAGP